MSSIVATSRKSQAADSLVDLLIQLAVGREYRTLRYFSDSLLRRVENLPADRVKRKADPLIFAFSQFILDPMFDDEQARRTVNDLFGCLVEHRVGRIPQGLDDIDRLVFNGLIPRFMMASKTGDSKTITRAAEGVVELPRILSGFIIASDLERFRKLADLLPALFHDELKNRSYVQFQLASANLIDALSAWQRMENSKAEFTPHVEQLLRAMIAVQKILLENSNGPEVVGPLADNILAVMRALIKIEYEEKMFPVALNALKSECDAIDKYPSLRPHLFADLENHASLAAQYADPKDFRSVLQYWSLAMRDGFPQDLYSRFVGLVAQHCDKQRILDVAIQFASKEFHFLVTEPAQKIYPQFYQYPLFVAALGIESKATFPEDFSKLTRAIMERLQGLERTTQEAVRKNIRTLWREMVNADMSDEDYDRVWEKLLAI